MVYIIILPLTEVGKLIIATNNNIHTNTMLYKPKLLSISTPEEILIAKSHYVKISSQIKLALTYDIHLSHLNSDVQTFIVNISTYV